jgi:hypothetical protein
MRCCKENLSPERQPCEKLGSTDTALSASPTLSRNPLAHEETTWVLKTAEDVAIQMRLSSPQYHQWIARHEAHILLQLPSQLPQ